MLQWKTLVVVGCQDGVCCANYLSVCKAGSPFPAVHCGSIHRDSAGGVKGMAANNMFVWSSIQKC